MSNTKYKKDKARNFFNISLRFYMYNYIKNFHYITHKTIFCMCTGCVTVYSVPQFGSKVSPIQSIPIVVQNFGSFFSFVLYVNCVNFKVHSDNTWSGLR